MAISNTAPVVIPATDEKEFPHIWIRSIRINAPSTTQGRAMFELCPYDSATGEILNQPRIVAINDLWAKINESTEFQTAMAAIFAAVDTIK
jgi:hypothetical protein